ncbi:MAG: biopolymer transporter ExbD [Candidatus Omnitrophica bacterium]|nr:biopolymer transporter ExbD [Candidatus Omnitrophota bacterium]
MRFKRGVSIQKGELDLIPLVNIIFLLFIFFIITSGFIFQPGLTVDLPRVVTSEIIPKESLEVVVAKNNTVYLNERPVTDEELISRFRIAAREGKPVLIKADRQGAFGSVVRILDLCRQEGVRGINVATTQEGRS